VIDWAFPQKKQKAFYKRQVLEGRMKNDKTTNCQELEEL
jgi:hypothetical protein